MTKVLKIYGPPGTGKTKTMLDLFEQELVTVSPRRIAFLTFTRAAKYEALGRTGRTQEDLPYLRTIHSICYRQLTLTPSQIIKDKDLRYFGKKAGVKLAGVINDPWASDEFGDGAASPPTAADLLLQLNHLGRHRRIGVKESLMDVNLDIDFKYAKWFTEGYRAWKEAESMYDYTDILTLFLRVGEPLDIDVLFVDEAQDLSILQWDVVHLLGAKAQRWYLCGDDDQAIFSWAGADAQRFINEPSHEQKILTQSYRLPRRILKTSQVTIHRVMNRVPKPFRARDEEGDVREINLVEPAMFAGVKTCFLLFRNHHRGRALAQEMERMGVAFGGPHSVIYDRAKRNLLSAWFKTTVPGEPWSNAEARAVIGIFGPAVRDEWVRPGSKDTKEKQVKPEDILFRIPTPEEWARLLFDKIKNIDYVKLAVALNGWPTFLNPRINLMSIHQSKGREADRVILDMVMARKTFEAYFRDPDAEHRVWYVGVTRARQELHTLSPVEERNYELGASSEEGVTVEI